MSRRRTHSTELKKRVALAALKESKTLAAIANEYQIHPMMVSSWKRQAIDGLEAAFQGARSLKELRREYEDKEAKLLEKIGQLTVELDWLKKNVTVSPWDAREMIESFDQDISIARQCELLGLSRATYYWTPAQETAENLEVIKRMDEIYTRHPYYGSRRMKAVLNTEGRRVNRKKIQRLMGVMELTAIYPQPKLSQPCQEDQKYLHLLKDLAIVEPNQVWASDITYIRMRDGFMYLVAVIDRWSRYVLSWELSNTWDVTFCVKALKRALCKGQPAIFNTDQGAQFTSREFTGVLLSAGIAISRDGRGRALDNVYVERLWRSVKYEEVYLKDYESVSDLRFRLTQYFEYYNNERLHQGLGYKTPKEMYHRQAA